MPTTSLGTGDYEQLDNRLAAWDEALATRYPGDDGSRQPVHTVYVPADRYHAGLAADWGAQARKLMVDHADSAGALADVAGIPGDLAEQVLPRVLGKLETEPVEDLRIDFEDGYGNRGDDEEDRAAREAARALTALA